MKRKDWNLLGNMFEVKTRRSFKKAFVFSQRHHNALYGQSSDPYVADIFNTFEPVFDSFEGLFSRWNMHSGEHKGAVQDLNETLLTISRRIKEWEGKIFFHYPEGTAETKAIFPNKRTPFYKGSHIARTNAVAVLVKALDEFPLLAGVKTEVENFHTLLHDKLQRRLRLEGTVKADTSKLELERKTITSAMYGNLGLLMYHYRQRTRMLKVYFDMGVIKNRVRRKKNKRRAGIAQKSPKIQ